jgi:hypothetical protein
MITMRGVRGARERRRRERRNTSRKERSVANMGAEGGGQERHMEEP